MKIPTHLLALWEREGTTVYALQAAGFTRKGTAKFENRFSANVQGKAPEAELIAVASLMAVSPDLLAALLDMRSKYHRSLIAHGNDPEFADLACESADQAIARATGAR